jgi:glucan endo-1,3-beta-D-glucosidase
MRTYALAALAATLPTTLAAYKGFNYGSNDASGAPKSVDAWTGEFNSAKSLSGVLVPFSSARLYTSIQPGTTDSPINAFEAAVNTGTSLLLGIWASGGSTQINNEIAAIQAAISAHGDAFTSLIAGISVGSEDVYRITALGVASNAGTGADPATIQSYVSQVKSTLNLGKPVGHTDTYNVWSNSSGWMSSLIGEVDFIGMNAFPYFENTKPNTIENANATYWGDWDATTAVAGGKPIWITETGWPSCTFSLFSLILLRDFSW